MNKWVFTFEELIKFKKQKFSDYTLFLKSKLGQRHDGSYICGTSVLSPREIDLIETKNSIYEDNLYLITSIDIDNRYIDFNSIGTKKDLLKYLESVGE
jgi:hypothetical protein